jgi:hypothetical protein
MNVWVLVDGYFLPISACMYAFACREWRITSVKEKGEN